MYVQEESLRGLARDALMLAKAGINYTNAVVICRDFHRERGKVVIRSTPYPPVSPR